MVKKKNVIFSARAMCVELELRPLPSDLAEEHPGNFKFAFPVLFCVVIDWSLLWFD
jgi:hypothetical protein